ncbi:alpha-hydroxy-acid oxidizing protein [Pseudomaricurvus alkylphenolicus]|uniref:alpha-hydroxy acid oxidase n=1 Tax=Pseudomaricurvus alkylphenolicus TaxID=1306991 RepID=UPI0014208D2A|nr:alpha-hydroxy acid oxidase [Pseudomaricurvus alkylphenolicus]NIB38670.1 alpha-hydroxy-acid oxidizing protein [Pseudomaricurvus alkylphenolicus]
MPALHNCHNISDLRKRAKRKLPAPMFHYIDGGSDDEWTLRRNTEAFDDYELMPSYLKDIESIDLKTKVLGTELDLPFFLSPTGMSRLFHHEKELGACRAAHKFGTMYSLSTLATTSLEEVGAATPGPKMFQIYILKDRELTREFVQRCKDSGYQALCLTVDTPLAGNRERDLYNGMTMPPKINARNFFSYGFSFEWLINLALNPDFKLANVAHRVDALGKGALALIDYVNGQFDRTVTWEDAAWLAEQWDGPFVIKGVQSPADARRALDIGASALMISNHGGRQLEGAPAPIDCIAPIRDAVGNQLELIMDGGVRRGTHVIKALAQGADACSIGRPYLYGLASGGQRGVERALELLKTEVERSMALLGVNSIAELGREHLLQR